MKKQHVTLKDRERLAKVVGMEDNIWRVARMGFLVGMLLGIILGILGLLILQAV